MSSYSEAAQAQRERWHQLDAIGQGRSQAGRAEAAWRDAALAGKPRLALACGHLTPAGDGPLAEAGFGYCDEHGVSRAVPAPEAAP